MVQENSGNFCGVVLGNNYQVINYGSNPELITIIAELAQKVEALTKQVQQLQKEKPRRKRKKLLAE